MNKFIEKQLQMNKYVGKRKHGSQLKQHEITKLFNRLKDVEQWKFSHHALDRLVEKGINATYDDIVSTIQNSEIIEYKINYNGRVNRCEERVVLRAKAIVNGEYNLNVVYSLATSCIVTVWINHINDNHRTLDWSIYDEKMQVFA